MKSQTENPRNKTQRMLTIKVAREQRNRFVVILKIPAAAAGAARIVKENNNIIRCMRSPSKEKVDKIARSGHGEEFDMWMGRRVTTRKMNTTE